jgi:hypothetical protein
MMVELAVVLDPLIAEFTDRFTTRCFAVPPNGWGLERVEIRLVRDPSIVMELIYLGSGSYGFANGAWFVFDSTFDAPSDVDEAAWMLDILRRSAQLGVYETAHLFLGLPLGKWGYIPVDAADRGRVLSDHRNVRVYRSIGPW